MTRLDYVRKYRAFPNGRPLPRQGGADGTVAKILDRLVECEPIGGERTRGGRVAALAKRCSRDVAYMRRVISGKRGLGPHALWEIGRGLRDSGLPWVSCPLMLSAEPAYEGHFLGTIGEVLRPGPTAEVREWWPILRSLCEPSSLDQAVWGRITTADYRTIDDDGRYIEPSEEPRFEGVAKARDAVTVPDELSKAFESAWRRWWDHENSARLASEVESLIESLRLHATRRVQDAMRADLRDWFEDAPSDWDRYGPYMRPVSFKEWKKRREATPIRQESDLREVFDTVHRYTHWEDCPCPDCALGRSDLKSKNASEQSDALFEARDESP